MSDLIKNKLRSFLCKNIYLLTEISIILIYSYIIFFSIIITPINIIFGIFCVLILPGYNLLKILKPEYNLRQLLGYITIFSLAIINILMLFAYIFLYNIQISQNNQGFYFNSIILILTIQFINLILIFIRKLNNNLKLVRLNRTNENHKLDKANFVKKTRYLINNIRLKVLIIYACFILSLIFLCISSFHSNIKSDDFTSINKDYRQNFTYFIESHLFFIFFL